MDKPVELDLARFRGRVPLEMMGRTAFPPIGELPYLLTLPACGFYWFRLSADVLGKLAQYGIMTFVVLIALDQVNVGGDIVRQSFLIILAGAVFALALAFGLGGKNAAAEAIDRWWPRENKGDGE